MALQLLAANNAQSVLAAGISASATSLTLNTGTGALFPSPVSGTSFFKLTLIDAATGQISEIVHVTAKSGDVLTIVRGQEGTSARAWSANDIAANMMTAGTLSYILGNFQPLDPTLTALAALVGVANKLPYFNGDDTAALTDLTQVGRDIIGKSTIADILTYLGIPEALALKANSADFVSAKTATTIVGNQPGNLRFMCGTASAPTDANGNVFITLPDTFLGRVIYAEAHQSKSSYVGDTQPYIFSSYPAAAGPVSIVSFAVRNSKTGAAWVNSAIDLMYFVRGY